MDSLTPVFREGFSYILHLSLGDSAYISKKITVARNADKKENFMRVWNMDEDRLQHIPLRSIVAFEPQFHEAEQGSVSSMYYGS